MPRIEICNRRIETCSRALSDAPGSAGQDPDDGFVEPLAPRFPELGSEASGERLPRPTAGGLRHAEWLP
jgi:hypothetical protein